MSYLVNPFPPVGDTPLFPLDGPPTMTPDWELAEVKFVQPAWDNAFGMHEFVEFTWMTQEVLGSSGLITKIVNQTAQYIADQGGQALAFRLYHRQVFDVSVPQQICLPSYIPYIGGCTDVPVIGGQTLLSTHQWHLQVVYHNAAEFIGVWGFLSLLLIVGVIAAAVLAMTHGSVDLGSTFTQPVKDVINQSAIAAKGVASSVAWVFLAGVALIAVLAIGVPQLGTQTTVHAGPVSTTLRGREPPSRAERRS